MSAAELRKAAETLRERANAATRPDEMHPYGDKALPPLPPESHASEVSGLLGGTWGYYATLHPGVGLELADLLARAAFIADEAEHSARVVSDQAMTYIAPNYAPIVEDARALARLINGGAS